MDATQDQIAAIVAAPELPEVSVLRVQPGDTIVVRLKGRLSNEQFEKICDLWAPLKKRFPDNELMIIEGDADILVLRTDGA